MSKQILIFGKGFIGGRLKDELGCALTGQKIYKYSDIVTELRRYKPAVIINAIGVTGRRNVDDCELEFEKTLTANSFVPIFFAGNDPTLPA